MDITPRFYISHLTKDREKQNYLLALLAMLQEDGFIVSINGGKYCWNSYSCELENISNLLVIAYWVVCVEQNLNLATTFKIRWKPFEQLFNLRKGSLKMAYYCFKRNHWYWDKHIGELNFIKKYTVVSTIKSCQTKTNHVNSQEVTFETAIPRVVKKCIEYITDKKEKQDAVLNLLLRLERNHMIKRTKDKYKWNKGITKLQIAYWIDRINTNLELNKTGNGRTIWNPFEEMFGLKKGSLRIIKGNWRKIYAISKKDFSPKGYEIIEPYTCYHS